MSPRIPRELGGVRLEVYLPEEEGERGFHSEHLLKSK